MKSLSLAGAAVAGLGILLAGSASSAPRNGPPVLGGAFQQRAANAAPRRLEVNRRGNAATPMPCSTDYAGGTNGLRFFVAIDASSEANSAGGNDSATLAGYDDHACDYDTGIGGGLHNKIGTGADTAAASFIGGGQNNTIGGQVAFIGAGSNNGASGQNSFVGAGENNFATTTDSFVGGGNGNQAKAQGGAVIAGTSNSAGNQNAVAGGGESNAASGFDSFLGAGKSNYVSNSYSFIGAGVGASVSAPGSFSGAGGYAALQACGCYTNGNVISGADSFIGAGDQNSIQSQQSFIGSGGLNVIGQSAAYSSIIGGNRNNVTGQYASIIGGFGNAAPGQYAIVAGGDGDTAGGTLTFAAGYHANAAHNGSFVWSDYVSGSTTVKDAAANQFVARASGGTTFYSNETMTTGVSLTAGSGTWASLSDRSAKTAVVPLDDASILAKVAKLPVSTWSYKSETGVRHIGPMAQDFYAAFGAGVDDRHITSIDEDGVALAAIKALHAQNARLEARLDAVERQNAELARKLEKLVR